MSFLLVPLLLLSAGDAAWAQGLRTTTDFAGKAVVAVEFQAPRKVDADQLRYLVAQEQGEPYSPQKVSSSVQRLFRLGQFDDVRARVRPVPGGVKLTFVLVPSPRISAIRLRGVRKLSQAVVRAALSRAAGDPYVHEDEVRLARQAEEQYRAHGFLDATVSHRLGQGRGGGKVIELRVDEGRPYRIGEIQFLPEAMAGFTQERLVELVGGRLRVGRIFREEDLARAVQLLLDRYRRVGYVEARVLRFGSRASGRLPVEVRLDREEAEVTIVLPVDAGRHVRTEFRFDGPRRPEWTTRRLEEVIGLVSAHRVSDSYTEEAANQLRRFLRSKGFLQAQVEVLVADEGAPNLSAAPYRQPRPQLVRRLTFLVTTGPRIVLSRSDVVVEGNEALSDNEVLQVLSDASPEVLGHRPALSLVLGLPIYRRFYTENAMEASLQVLRDYYRARGFLNVGLSHVAEFVGESEDSSRQGPDVGGVGSTEEGQASGSRAPAPSPRLRVAVSIDEGIQTSVEGLSIETPVTLDRRLLVGWRRRLVDRPFNPSAVDELAAEARLALSELGYLDAEVEIAREFSDDGTLVRLMIRAEPGVAARFGQVLVRENRHTHVGLIRRDVPVQAGDVYRPSVLKSAQARLLRSGLFRQVEIGPVQTIGRVRDVEVIANERNRFSFLFGAGVTAPDDGPRLSGEARLRNLDGRGFSLWTRGRVSVDWRYLTFDVVPRPEYRAALGAELPYIPGVPVRGTVSVVINEELDEPTFRLSRSMVSLSAGWRGAEGLNLDGRVEFQLRAPIRVDPTAQLSPRFDKVVENPLLHPHPFVLLGISAVVDRRDDPFNPTRGLYASLAADTTPSSVLPDSPAFGRAIGRVVGLIPFGDQGFGLQLEAGGGVLWSYDGELAPVEWRFRLGGTSTVRGYRIDSIGPSGLRSGALQDLGLLSSTHADRRVAVGGNAFYRYSVQFQFPLPFVADWRLVVFHDAGNALLYGDVPDGIHSSRAPPLHATFGIGLRRITPIGPLRLDVAFRPEQFDDAGRIALGELVQVHFAVGAL